MADDILLKLTDLHKQATEERSHYYVGSCVRESIAEITHLRTQLALKDKALRDLLFFVGSANAYDLDNAAKSEAYQNAAKVLDNHTEEPRG